MNKILLVNDKIEEIKISKNIALEEIYSEEDFKINEITIKVKKSEDLTVILNSKKASKLKINIILDNGVNSNLTILSTGINYKVCYEYKLNEFSKLNVLKYNSIDSINEMVQVSLNGLNASIDYILKSISNNKESYDYNIFHNVKNTFSNIKNNGVNIKDSMNIQISGYVYKESTGCICKQNNRIINLTENKCEIRPILYIDTDDIEANHSALIGDFEDEELFYLNTMGISKTDAYNLLVKGFLLSDITSELLKEHINEDINKYWR